MEEVGNSDQVEMHRLEEIPIGDTTTATTKTRRATTTTRLQDQPAPNLTRSQSNQKLITAAATNNPNGSNQQQQQQQVEKPGIMDRWVSWMNRHTPSYILQNKGSVARDHLANERTYLAYLRTSLSLVTVGIAVTQLFRLNSASASQTEITMGKVIGSLFVIIGLLFIFFGAIRYFYSQALMVKGLFPASRGSITFGSLLLVAITVFIFIISMIYI